MNKKMTALCLAALGVASNAHAYNIDSSIADWIANPGSLSAKASVKYSAVEDQAGSGAFYLNPGWGGQTYDAEALYVDWDASNLYVAIVTGLSPNNPHNPGANSYGAGDILFNFGGGSTFEYGLAVTTLGGLTKGGVYGLGSLTYGLWSAPGTTGPAPNPYPVAVKSGVKKADAVLSYSAAGFTGIATSPSDTHYVIEASIPVSAFGTLWNGSGPAQDMTIWWGALCANDIIEVDVGAVPEPGSLLLSALGLAGLGALRRRRIAAA